MKLTVHERLILPALLPSKEDFLTLRILRKLKEDLSFSEEEHKKLKFRQEDTQIFWDTKSATEKDIEFGDIATKLIVEKLKSMNEKKELTTEHISLYEKFVEKPN